VSWRGSPPSSGNNHSCAFSFRDEVKATVEPSGEIAGAEFVESLNVSRRVAPVSTSRRYRSLCSTSSSSSALPAATRVCAKTTRVAPGDMSAATTNLKPNKSSGAIARVIHISSWTGSEVTREPDSLRRRTMDDRSRRLCCPETETLGWASVPE